jgi:hypothetical protein
MRKTGRAKACWNLAIAQANVRVLLEWLVTQGEAESEAIELAALALTNLGRLQSWYERQHQILDAEERG